MAVEQSIIVQYINGNPEEAVAAGEKLQESAKGKPSAMKTDESSSETANRVGIKQAGNK
jgi:hypothetical protein